MCLLKVLIHISDEQNNNHGQHNKRPHSLPRAPRFWKCCLNFNYARKQTWASVRECMKNDAGYDCAQAFAIWSLSFKSIRTPRDSVNSKTESHSSVSSYQEWRIAFFPRRFEFVHLQQKSSYTRDSIITEVIEHLLTIPLHKPRVKTLGTLLSCTNV